MKLLGMMLILSLLAVMLMKQLRKWFADFRAGRLPSSAVYKTAKKERDAMAPAAFFDERRDGVRVVERLRFPGVFHDHAYLRNCARADWQHVQPPVREFAARFIEEARKRGIPLYVHSAFRTRDEQDALVAAGNSFAKWPRSAHCQGAAVDIVHHVFHWDMSQSEWAYLHWLGAETLRRMNEGRLKSQAVVLTWGGDWDGDGDIHDQRLYDPAHWELATWKSDIRKLEVGEKVSLTPRALLARL